MPRNTPVAIFLAATAALSAGASINERVVSAENQRDLGGLKEWTTDQDIDEESELDEAAQEAAIKAKKNDICIPIGEGENCW